MDVLLETNPKRALIHSLMIIAIMLMANFAFAADEWFCTSQASKRQGPAVYACGIGKDTDEDMARTQAFESAKAEFDRICDASDACKDHEILVDPLRTTCDRTKDGYKCYRLVVFTVKSQMRKQRTTVVENETVRPIVAQRKTVVPLENYVYEPKNLFEKGTDLSALVNKKFN